MRTWHEEGPARGAQRRRRRHRRQGRDRLVPDPIFGDDDDLDAAGAPPAVPDAETLAPAERAYREAHLRAEQKVRLYGKMVKAALVTVPLLIFLPWLGVIMLFVFGVDIGKRWFRLMVEPKLRERLVEEEVQKQLHASVSQERRALEGEHSRSLEQLSASIAHEIRNPITAAKSLVQQMGEEPAARENVEYARVALEELERVERSISHLLRFARDEELRAQEIRMADVLDSALETFRDRAARAGVEIAREIDGEGPLLGDPEKLRRVVINLIGNAIDALEEAKTPAPRIEVALGENLAGTEVWVRIRDNGPGIDGALHEKIFSPFYTSKPGGTGLGLAITRKLMEAHGGAIELASRPGSGAEFVLTFPKHLAPAAAGSDGGRS
jgi:signal transduction histidine kinase